MSSNPYIAYYSEQSGNGLPGFSGYKYMRGKGFFSNLFRSSVMPMLRFLGKKSLSVGKDLAGDFLSDPDNFKETAKTRLKSAGVDLADAAYETAKRKMTGGARKRRKRRTITPKRKPARRMKKVTSKTIKKRKPTKKKRSARRISPSELLNF
jgi:hypothetical protein